MRIGEFAARVGASPRSLRHYEQQGLLSPDRDANGHRTYDAHAVEVARNIKELLASGLTTGDVLGYLEAGCLGRPRADSPRCAAELDAAERRLAGVEERLARLQEARERLVGHRARVAAGVAARQAKGEPQ
ncbi:MerR family transcriptional regulator [Streptomyces sp. NPDC021093]|uniref:MerR family transcriptional regulator n=1 Tax=Streptomyces sp. NPDC021093 TaxID=3365112 RepID=UPI0037A75E8F